VGTVDDHVLRGSRRVALVSRAPPLRRTVSESRIAETGRRV
jgi:hypothetical protein